LLATSRKDRKITKYGRVGNLGLEVKRRKWHNVKIGNVGSQHPILANLISPNPDWPLNA
jgi:hypothetical protein